MFNVVLVLPGSVETQSEVVNFVNSCIEYSFLFSLMQKVKKSTNKSQSYNQRQSGTFFMAQGIVRV